MLFLQLSMSCHAQPYPLFYEEMCNQLGTYDYFSNSKRVVITCQNSEPSDTRQVVIEQETGRASDENKTMIHRLSSFQPSELSGFE